MSVLVVGSMALDSVETPFGVREEVLGGSATYFSASASFFAKPMVVAVVGEDFPREHLELLRSRGADLSGVKAVPGKTFRWRGRYTYELNEAHTLETQLNVFQDFAPHLPESYRAARYVFLGNIHPKLQLEVLSQVEGPELVAADTMNFWIEKEPAALRETLKRVQLLFVNDAEARQLSGEHNIVKAARGIRKMGPDRVVIKRGEYGALLFDGDHIFTCPAYPLLDVFDPTGAGDSFAGGFMGYVSERRDLSHDALRRAMVVGSAMASFAVEKFSLERIRELNRREIDERFAAFRKLTTFEEGSLST